MLADPRLISAHFLAHRRVLGSVRSHGGRVEGTLGDLLSKGTPVVPEDPPHDLINPPKAPPPNTIALSIKI